MLLDEDMPFCSSERLCLSPDVNKVWICKHWPSSAVGLLGEISSQQGGFWALDSVTDIGQRP